MVRPLGEPPHSAERTVRVSSDNMPEDGQRVFGEIEQVLRKAWKIYGPKQ